MSGDSLEHAEKFKRQRHAENYRSRPCCARWHQYFLGYCRPSATIKIANIERRSAAGAGNPGRAETVKLNIRSQGVVVPRTEIDLVPEVAGQIIQLHPSLVAGGFFEAGDILVTIDPRDYDYAIAEALPGLPKLSGKS